MRDAGANVVDALRWLALKKPHPLRIVECGTIRNPTFEGHEDGLATYHIACWLKSQSIKHEFFSFELSVGAIQACKEFLATHKLAEYVTFGLGNADLLLEHFNLNLDFCYLDAGADPTENLSQYRRAEKWMRPPGFVIIDDVFDVRNANRGLVTVPYAQLDGRKVANLSGRQALISFEADHYPLRKDAHWL